MDDMKRALLAIAFGSAFVACTNRVATVDMRRVFSESEQGKAATASLQALAGPRLQQIQAAPADQREALNARLKADVEQEDKRLSGAVVVAAAAAAGKVAAARGYADVRESSGLLWSKNDITADVIKRMNEAKASPPQAANDDLARERQRSAALQAENDRLRQAAAPPPAPAAAPTKVAQAGPPQKPDASRKK